MRLPKHVLLYEPDGKPVQYDVSRPARLGAKGTGLWGQTLHSQRRISIRSGLDNRETIATLIHESIHVACRDLEETAVLRIEANIMEVLDGVIEEGQFVQ